jgi:TPR repeat protein
VIQKTLERIDKDGRPLYAYFLGQMIGQDADINNWSKVDILREVLGREREKWWAAAFKDRNKPPRTEDDFPASRLAILATMIDGLDCEDAQKKEFIPVPTADDREQALALTGNPMSEDMDGSPPMVIPSMQPDLLGEWYVIVSLEKPWSPLKELTDIAWRYAPEKMGHFMQKLFQDFHDSPTTAAILECIDPDRIEINTLSKLINDLLTFLVAHRLAIPEKITQTLHILADSGDPQSLSSLGLCFDCGIGVEMNIHEAVNFYQKAADAGNAIALNMLGLCHQFGNGVDESISKAADYFKRAVEAGSPDAMNNYAACLQLGKGVEENIPEAVYWYRKAAEADITNAMINYGFCYDKGTGVKEDKQEAAFWYKNAADNGSSYAMYRLGLCYQYGIGVEENISKAMYWQQEAAELGNVCAMCELGGFNEDGVDKEQDYSKAIYCYKEAVKAVESNMASFGMYRQAGTEGEKSTFELIDWQHKGEKRCYAVALYKIGHFYENGLGVEKDVSIAVGCYKKAAKHGHKSAMFSLGAFYLDGEVVEKDATKAAELYERAANLGHVAAMNNIGYFYENEIGVERDFLRAFEYYQKAADFGNETAKIYIDSYRFAVKLLNGNNDDDTIVSTLKGLSFQHCLFDDWPDTPLSIGNWFIPLNDWAFWLLIYLYHGIKYH